MSDERITTKPIYEVMFYWSHDYERVAALAIAGGAGSQRASDCARTQDEPREVAERHPCRGTAKRSHQHATQRKRQAAAAFPG